MANFAGSRLNSVGRSRINRTASLPMSLNLRCSGSSISGRTCATAPTSKSDALIRRLPGSVTKYVPDFQVVFSNSFLGSGPKSRSSSNGESADSPRAAPSDFFIKDRRPNPEAAAPDLTVSTNSLRSESGERNSWRCATTSVSGIKVLAQ